MRQHRPTILRQCLLRCVISFAITRPAHQRYAVDLFGNNANAADPRTVERTCVMIYVTVTWYRHDALLL